MASAPVPPVTDQGRRDLAAALARTRDGFLTVGLFSFFQNLLMLTLPLYMLQIYDRVLVSRSIDTLIMLTIVAVGLLAVGGGLDALRGRVLLRLGNRIDDALDRRTFAALHERRLDGSDKAGTQPLRDLDTLRTYLSGSGVTTFFDAPWTPLFIGLIFVLHPWLGALALAGALLLFSLALLSELLTRRPVRAAARASSSSANFAEASLRNAELTAALGMIGPLYGRWSGQRRDALIAQATAGDRSTTLGALAKFIRQLLQVGMLGLGAYLAVGQEITPGMMIAGSIIMGRALAPVEASIGAWRNFVAARDARGRLTDFLDQVPRAAAGLALPAPNGHLKVEALYGAPPAARKPLLRNLSFEVPPGRILGIIGPSAAGKSTLARLLVGVWRPGSGAVRLDGADIAGWERHQLGPYIGYLPQDVELFDGTVAENIARLGPDDAAGVVRAAQAARAHEMILRLPDGYDTVIGEGGGALSGGQRQRIGLARALYGDPRLIVLDEPNANLDNAGEIALRDALAQLRAEDRAVVVITHRPTLLAVTDDLMMLKDGAIETYGPRPDVLKSLTRVSASTAPSPVGAPAAVQQGS
jgi:PrtD family type I secretion system ABC transporter